MKYFKNISIKKKLSLIALITCITALTLAGVALLVNEVSTFRRTLVNAVASEARLLAGLSTAALTFEDKAAAGEMLTEMANQKHIDQAILFRNGEVFGSYRRPGTPVIEKPVEPAEDGEGFFGGQLVLHRKVMMKGEHVGTVYLLANTDDLYSRLFKYAMILLGVFAAATTIALMQASRLQATISNPVLHLANVADSVAKNQDYSVRVEKFGEDEVGRLTDAFNQMLSQIQTQDAALNVSQQKLESLVNSISGIVWERDTKNSKFNFVSPQVEAILGYTLEKCVGTPGFWEQIVHPDDLESATKAYVDAAARRLPYSNEYRMIAADQRVLWVRESGVVLVEDNKPVALRGIFLDITEQKRAAQQLANLNERIAQTQRQAGMAEVATGVLHNVGNVLNSVNVSASLLRDNVNKSQISNLVKATNLLRDHAADSAAFLTSDPKGQRLPGYLIKLGDHIASEQLAWKLELDGLGKNIEHIKEIVAMQQSYARLSGISEAMEARELVEDAIRINESALGRHGIKLVRDFQEVPPVTVDKHKVLQILINLIRNAKYALDDAGKSEKILTLAILNGGNGRVHLQVRDNGVGISAENLSLIFQHGFTTKKDGHGFGLHSGANAAREMGGKLFVQSDGPGTGASFTLELPIAVRESAPQNS